jgi:hypothetical protein
MKIEERIMKQASLTNQKEKKAGFIRNSIFIESDLIEYEVDYWGQSGF